MHPKTYNLIKLKFDYIKSYDLKASALYMCV